jgi:hypothetical protein
VVDEDDEDGDLRATCDVSPDNPDTGDTVTWRVRVSGGDGDYDYRWSGDVTGDNRTETKRYTSSGRKEATVRITSDGDTIRKTCSVYVDRDGSNGGSSNAVLFENTPPAGNLTSGVFLSDLPYTGVSKGLKVTLFFLGLAIWSIVVAYIFYKKYYEKEANRKLTHKELVLRFKEENKLRKYSI